MPTLKVALLGANGNVGAPILSHLLSSNHSVTVLHRPTSTSPLPSHPNLHPIPLPSSPTVTTLTPLLKNHDAVIIAIPLTSLDFHLDLATAAAHAGVKHYIPADFGSVDSGAPLSQKLVPLFGRKSAVRQRLTDLAGQHAGFTWTALVNGHFFDWALKTDFMHFDVRGRKALVLGDGEQRMSLSTLARVAEATVRVLEMGAEGRAEVRGRTLMVQSFCVTQWEVLRALEGVTGGRWEVEREGVEGFVRREEGRRDRGSKAAVEELVFALGVMEGDWTRREEFAMGLLGLEDEDLGEVVGRVVREVEAEGKGA
ncbi:hypothetical protein BDZ85DRAFT_32838 [Elsinoe ampelina]|uniref:NAD(P)-binding domain-containing protein n=1 Tax=Elsinoe ampelina TaxID=302913 RepID=A0A6A6G3T3_9PEZI|nr:hypothetical protein BDZ85DRAFT_32838 [Elsinoe ampelina]